ncbi:MAG: DUF6464 family protein [Cyanobacteria bacterium P01_H01_bin.121]
MSQPDHHNSETCRSRVPKAAEAIANVFLSCSQELIGQLELTWEPQPGSYIDLDQQTYQVLERRHRYQLRNGRYQLHQVLLYVKTAIPPSDRTPIDGRWVVGDASCAYNARSELLRCTVNPTGPCLDCCHYQAEPN